MKPVLLVVLTLCGFLSPFALHAQAVVGEDRLVGVDGPTWPIAEPHLAVNPNNGSHLIAAGITVQSVDWAVHFATSCALFATRNGGVSWSRHDFEMEECGDPWVAITADGAAIFTALGRPNGGEDG